MNSGPNIDELLNGYIDGELTPRQHTEVQRMISHDRRVASRLRQLANCKRLVSALPVVEAPDDTLEKVKASLERRLLLGDEPLVAQSGKGARHLFMRKFAAAAAMFILVGFLVGVIYSIVAPVGDGGSPSHYAGPIDSKPAGTTDDLLAKAQLAFNFWGRLELKTASFVAVDAVLNRTIEENGISGSLESGVVPNGKLYSVRCTREAMIAVLAELDSVWDRVDDCTLYVEADQFAQPVTVGAATARQISDIIAQRQRPECIELARNIAAMNSLAQIMPSGRLLATITGSADVEVELPVVHKPVVTARPQAVRSDQKPEVNLTIVLLEN